MSLRKLTFKWLAGLSFRRSSDKSDSAISSSKMEDATPRPPALDDIDGVRPRAGSYVRSSENYTHIGTLPRMFRKRRDKNSKGSDKNSKDKSGSKPAGDPQPARPLEPEAEEGSGVEPEPPSVPEPPDGAPPAGSCAELQLQTYKQKESEEGEPSMVLRKGEESVGFEEEPVGQEEELVGPGEEPKIDSTCSQVEPEENQTEYVQVTLP